MDERATRQEGEWLIVHALRRTLWHVDEGWDRIDRAHRRRWMVTMAIGFVLMLSVTMLLVALARLLESRGVLAWERPFLEWIVATVPVPFSWAIWLESPGNAIVLWPLIIAATGIAAWHRRPLLAITILAGFLLLDAAVMLGWTSWPRVRPEFVAGGAASPSKSLSAFPSGHVSQTIVAYGLFIALWREQTRVRGERFVAWLVLALVTSIVAFGRLRLGAHWPTDIVAGALIGGFWLFFLLRALRLGESR
jgi:membrane-associated phospholipid phosphatase